VKAESEKYLKYRHCSGHHHRPKSLFVKHHGSRLKYILSSFICMKIQSFWLILLWLRVLGNLA